MVAVTKKKVLGESSSLAQRIGDGRDILRRILAETVHPSKFKVFLGEPSITAEFREMREEILRECHDTFRSCFHAFYPTGQLKWWCLCDLLLQMEPVSWTCGDVFLLLFWSYCGVTVAAESKVHSVQTCQRDPVLSLVG